ncbi:MAG: peptidase U32 family protein [Pseudomonadota bacterium]
MKGNSVVKPELLAPAGSLDVFATAVEEGADAVYIGAPALNARALAKNFTPEELASMIDYGRRSGVKVYMAMNSLVKEEEIPQLVELLALLEQLSPDALIIQDLGLYSLVRKYFPSFALHASTLMGAHNSLAVQQFADMGFKRVVLAREVTLAETEKIHSQCPVELEVFVHGALCFSYSGLCLFSSYLGGKSSLRGRCVQPCRRKYGWAGEVKGPREGYFFSMNDLEGIDFLPRLARAGVVSLKIEGRMRSQSYVGSVVRAYRKMIDAGDNAAEVMPEVQDLLHQAMGRKPTGGYFFSPQPTDAITPFTSGNIGHFLGRIDTVHAGRLTLTLHESIETGDRVRLHHENSGDRTSFTVKDVHVSAVGKKGRGEKDEGVTLLLPGANAEPGDMLYKVDVRSRRQMAASKNRLTPPSRFHPLIEKIKKGDRASKVIKSLSLLPSAAGTSGKKRGSPQPAPGKPQSLPVWVRGDLRVLTQPVIDRPDRLIVTLDRETAGQLQGKKMMRHVAKTVTFSLPSVILEEDVSFYRLLVRELLQKGYRSWMISHIGQLQLFGQDGKKPAGGRRTPHQGPVFVGDYTLNVLNSLTMQFLRESGIGSIQISIETDRDNLQMICERKKKGVAGLTVFARPALFTARLHPEFFQFNKTFVSPKGERFSLQQKWGQTLALPDKPFSLLGQVAELKTAGLDFVVIDLVNVSFHKKEMADLRRTLSSRGKGRSQNSFNYFRTLQ